MPVRLEVQQAEVTQLEVDAIANAANTDLAHGGGVAAGDPACGRMSDRQPRVTARPERGVTAA